MRKLFFLFLALVATTSLWAEDFSVGGIYYNYLDGNNVEVTYRGDYYYRYPLEYSGEVTIPSTVTYNGTTYSVTSIGDEAFSSCSSLTSITIPNSVTSIGSEAFSRCSSLTSVTIPNSVTSIGDRAFYVCSSLTSITIGNSVTSIGDEAFHYCSSLTSITIPNSVTSIGDRAFDNCSSLVSMVVGGDNTTYDSRDNCNAIIETATNILIAGCQNTIIPNSVTSIGDEAFSYCSSLTSITIPNSVTSIGNSAFNDCSSLTSITIPNSVTSIGNQAFAYCSSLTSITIPESVTSIGDDAFQYCSSLTSITIPNSVTSIGDGAFRGCSSLVSMVVGGGNTTYDSRDNCNAIIETATNILIAGCQNTIIPNSVTSIGDWAFYACSSLTSVTIPNSVTSIGNSAFSGCYSLTSITIPNSVTSIGRGAFRDCSALTSVTIPNSVTSIRDEAFRDCSSLTSITIPNSVTSIGWYAFLGCSSLTSITIPNSVTSIGNQAFAYCSSLTFITIPNSVTSIGNWAFYGCSALDTISINATTPPTLGEEALSSVSICYIPMCTQVDYVNSNWNDYVDTFEEYLLYAGSYGPNIKWKYKDSKLSLSGTGNISKLDCTPWELLIDSIKEIEIENGITKIPADAFSNYTKLNKITLPSSLEEIGANAFANCRRLYEIYSYASIPPLAEMSSFTNYNATLYVPCEHKQYYQSDMVFSLFNKVECISSEEVETEDVIIESGTTTVIITWPTEGNADTYTIVIKKDGEVVCTLTFNSEGQLLNIAFAPGRNGNHPVQYAEAVANGGYRFTVTGLTESTDYTYNITVKDAANKTIKSHSGKFTTESLTAVENTHSQSPITNCQKILRDGQLLILRDGVEYNAMGQEL